MYRYYPRKQPFYVFFVSPRSDTLFVILSLAELSWFPYRIMTLWTSLSAFIYELLLPSCLRLRVAGTRKSAVNGHPFHSSGIPVQALFSHASSNLAAVSGSCCFHTTDLLYTLAIQTAVLPFVSALRIPVCGCASVMASSPGRAMFFLGLSLVLLGDLRCSSCSQVCFGTISTLPTPMHATALLDFSPR